MIELRFVKRIRNIKNNVDYQIPFKAKECDESDYQWSQQATTLHNERNERGQVSYCPDLS